MLLLLGCLSGMRSDRIFEKNAAKKGVPPQLCPVDYQSVEWPVHTSMCVVSAGLHGHQVPARSRLRCYTLCQEGSHQLCALT